MVVGLALGDDGVALERRSAFTVVYEASAEIRSSILNATLIIMVAFVPLFFLSGMEGRMLKPLGVAYIIALFMSLIVAMTVTPLLCRMLLADDRYLSRNERQPWLTRRLTDRLSIAAGGYLSNATWAHDTFREAGLTAVLGYQFDEHWSGYLYGQKSLRRNQPMPCLLQDIHDMGDKIGAAIRYSFSPSFSVQLNIEKRFLNDSGFYIPKSPTPLDKR